MAPRGQNIVDEEVFFDESEQLVSITDARGVIIYANDSFCKVAGYSKEELLRKNHNIVRHPDMPKAAFKDLWQQLEAGHHWQGIVKNRCKDGRYYWVNAYVTPMYDHGKLIGYQSVRVKPSDKLKQKAQVVYGAINENKLGKAEDSKLLIRHGMSIVALLAVLATIFLSMQGITLAIMLFALVVLFVSLYDRLVTIPHYIKQQKQNYPSICRAIYTDGGATSILEFRQSLYQARIRTILGRTNDSLNVVCKVIEELNHSIADTNEKITEQNNETAQIATSMHQMSATITDVSQNVLEASERVGTVNQACDQSMSLIDGSLHGISSLREKVSSAHDFSQQLVTMADSIDEQTSEIQGIANQTNLLALNAAIEAARAGEQGRGFAVVADEVRSLSNRTHTVSEGINEAVNQIKAKLLQVAQLMNDNMQTSDSCVDSGQAVHKSTETIVQQMRSIADLTNQVATAAEQQSVVSDEVNQNVQRVADLAQALVDSDILSKNIALLNDETKRLNELAYTFEQGKR